jgi:UDP:flavonoid glycosyltransferase YjiC (YdhE family)
MGFDQPDNATRLARLGVAGWVTPGKFTGKRVAVALKKLLGLPGVLEACDRWRQRIAAEQPLQRTCEIIEEVAERELR